MCIENKLAWLAFFSTRAETTSSNNSCFDVKKKLKQNQGKCEEKTETASRLAHFTADIEDNVHCAKCLLQTLCRFPMCLLEGAIFSVQLITASTGFILISFTTRNLKKKQQLLGRVRISCNVTLKSLLFSLLPCCNQLLFNHTEVDGRI